MRRCFSTAQLMFGCFSSVIAAFKAYAKQNLEYLKSHKGKVRRWLEERKSTFIAQIVRSRNVLIGVS